MEDEAWAFPNMMRKSLRVPVKALSQGFLGRNPSKGWSLPEPVIGYDARGSFKIFWAHAQKAQIGLHRIFTGTLGCPGTYFSACAPRLCCPR